MPSATEPPTPDEPTRIPPLGGDHSHSAGGTDSLASRAARVRAVVENCLERRSAGESLPDEQVIAASPDLQPELGRELALLRLLERAKAASRSRSGSASIATVTASGEPSPAATAWAGRPADWLEGYHIVREVHRGGQGVVYEAIQRSTGQRVAVKIGRESYLAGRRDSERFQREVEILAQLEHPNIVGVIDSGVYDGSVYFVMDYVDGLPIDEHLASRKLSIREVLVLFEKIAAAVNAAHLRGVIHRDLKPANILVDESGEPHLLDFGLARLKAEIGQAARAGQTMTGQFVGSLPWASPEQAEGMPAKIDLRTDVYSLGVILFQMLTGAMPYRVDESDGGLRTALSVILTAQPPRPSAVRARLRDTNRSSADERGWIGEGGRGGGGIDADIDTITLKCLSKERERRYQSAGELAADIRRYLENRPIAARPPSLRYQFNRFARRNRSLVAASLAIAAALGVGAVSTLVQLSRAREAERLAERRRHEAEHQAYIANIAAADGAITLGDGGTAALRLDSAPPSLRRWDWGYLRARSDRSIVQLPIGKPATGAFAPTAPGGPEPAGNGLIILAHEPGTVLALDAGSLTPVWRQDLPGAYRVSVAGQRAIAISRTSALVLDTASGRVLARFRIADPPITATSATLIGDTRLAAITFSRSVGVEVLNIDTGEKVFSAPKCPKCHTNSAHATADGTRLAYFDNADLVIRDTSDWHEMLRVAMRLKEGAEYGFLRFSPDGRRIAIAVENNVRLIDAVDGRRIASLDGHRLPVLSLAFDHSGQRLITGSIDKSIRVWSPPAGDSGASSSDPLWSSIVLCGHAGTVRSLCPLDDGDTFWSFGDEGVARVWSLRDAERTGVIALEPVATDLPSTCWFGRDDRLWQVSGEVLNVFDPAQARMVRPTVRVSLGFVSVIDPGADAGAAVEGGRAFGLFNATTIKAVQLASDRELWRAPCPLSLGWNMGVSPNGTVLACSDRDHAIRLWRAADGSPIATMTGHSGRLRMIRFSRDGRMVASSADDGEARTWSVASRQVTAVFHRESVRMMDCDLSPDDRFAAAGDDGGVLSVFDAHSGSLRWSSPPLGAAITSVLYHPDGARIATGGHDGLVRIWDAATGDELLQLRGHSDIVSGLAWSFDGRWLATTAYDRRVRLWDGGRGYEQPTK